MTFDFYPTPANTAISLVQAVQLDNPRVIADFSAGAGNLLVAAREKWPRADIVATDIQRRLIQQVSTSYPDWKVGTCDFLSSKSIASCRVLRELKGSIDVAVLNPPFSTSVPLPDYRLPSGDLIKCGTAIRFLLRASEYISPNGEISAIMPISALHGARDKIARDYLESIWHFEIGKTLGRKVFKDCFAETVLISLRKGPKITQNLEENKSEGSKFIREIKRGTIQVHTAISSKSQSALPFVHSSNLTNNKITNCNIRVKAALSTVTGPGLLLHRVGRPDVRKVAVLPSGKKIAISDCVIAILTKSPSDTKLLFQALHSDYDRLAALYKGTGAPYITLDYLRNFFSARGLM